MSAVSTEPASGTVRPRDVLLGGNVLWLAIVSLLTDTASEMIYPLLPLFLVGTLGAGPAFLGLVEGVAESASSLLKLASGWASDRLRRRRPLRPSRLRSRRIWRRSTPTSPSSPIRPRR